MEAKKRANRDECQLPRDSGSHDLSFSEVGEGEGSEKEARRDF